METMVTQKHKSPGVAAGVPSSVSGGGLQQNSMECTKSTFTVLPLFSFIQIKFLSHPVYKLAEVIYYYEAVQQCMS